MMLLSGLYDEHDKSSPVTVIHGNRNLGRKRAHSSLLRMSLLLAAKIII